MKRLRLKVLLPLAILFLSSCSRTLPQDALSPEGKYSRITNNLWNFVFPIAVAVFILVQTIVIVIVIKYRRKSDDEIPKQVHGNSKLELTWTIIPALILAVVGFKTIVVLNELNTRPSAKSLPVHVQVIGHQWWWEFAYPIDGNIKTDCTHADAKCIRTANEMIIPADRPVDVRLQSVDVIHSFWPPRLAGKVDVVSGRTNYMTIEADKPGEYYGQCAEYCGLSHANMRFRIFAKTTRDYNQWLKDQQQPANTPQTEAEKAGHEAFMTKGCVGCHTINQLSKGAVGPNLTHFASRQRFAGSMFDTTEPNLRRWLENPPEEKPGSQMPDLNLDQSTITNLIAYLDSLK